MTSLKIAKRQSQPQVSLLSFLSAPKKARRTEPNHQGELDSEDELDPVPVIASEQEVETVTSIHTVCEAMNSNELFKEMLPAVHKLLRLHLTIPITSATAERTFSALKRLFTYLRSTMTEKRLNNCLMLHVHKEFTDSLDLISVAKIFVSAYDERKKYFGNYN